MKQSYLRSLPGLMLKDEIDLKTYISRREDIEEKYKQTKSWNAVITSVVYFDEPTSQEAFIDVIEEMYSTKVKDPKHLLELTVISVDWTAATLKFFLQLCICTNHEVKLGDAIEHDLKCGAKYADILKYELKDYGLPETWINWWGMETNKDDLIKMAIYYAFELSDDTSGDEIIRLAEKIDAPYSLIDDVVHSFGSHLDNKAKYERFKDLKLMGYSFFDSFNKEENTDRSKWS